MKKKTTLAPWQARTQAQLCALPRDGVDAATWWALLDGDMILCQQRTGKAATGRVDIPRAEWDALVDWYETGRWKSAKAKKRPTLRKA